jgi:hypothetical protein
VLGNVKKSKLFEAARWQDVAHVVLGLLLLYVPGHEAVTTGGDSAGHDRLPLLFASPPCTTDASLTSLAGRNML